MRSERTAMSEPQDDVSWWGRRLHQAEQEARQAGEDQRTG